jgi:uncharacterized circularly permuted ATP-grasp superfamily protein
MVPIFDEMHGIDGAVRPAYAGLADWLAAMPDGALERKRREADILFRRIGITFAVYGEGGDTERVIPFDLVPRVLAATEWATLAAGLEQRVKALNAFLRDVYGGQEILRAGRVPADLVLRNPQYQPMMAGVVPPGGVYTTIAGIDIVRVDAERFYVLEDNARTPSGVSYMLENRSVMMRLFPDLFARMKVAPVEN